MRAFELTEGINTPCVVVDVQPSYTGIYDGDELPWIDEMMRFLNRQRGPILMFVNADETGMTDDNVEHDIIPYWEDSGFENWNNVTINDKGYGYLRGWMDQGVEDAVIIKTIREMYSQKVYDSRELFPDEDDYSYAMEQFLGWHWQDFMADDPISVEWISLGQLKAHSPCYIMGGAREECLREVELMMNAFNIKYKRIERFVYG